MSDGDIVALVVNWQDKPFEEFWFDFKDIGLTKWEEDIVNIRDLTAQRDIGNFEKSQANGSSFLVNVLPGHATRMYRFNLVKRDQLIIQK